MSEFFTLRLFTFHTTATVVVLLEIMASAKANVSALVRKCTVKHVAFRCQQWQQISQQCRLDGFVMPAAYYVCHSVDGKLMAVASFSFKGLDTFFSYFTSLLLSFLSRSSFYIYIRFFSSTNTFLFILFID